MVDRLLYISVISFSPKSRVQEELFAYMYYTSDIVVVVDRRSPSSSSAIRSLTTSLERRRREAYS